jgi:hypothetical protein
MSEIFFIIHNENTFGNHEFLPWNVEIMEYWNSGEKPQQKPQLLIDPSFYFVLPL